MSNKQRFNKLYNQADTVVHDSYIDGEYIMTIVNGFQCACRVISDDGCDYDFWESRDVR